MKLVPEGELTYGTVKSEGKLLQVIPLIDTGGNQLMLPPVVYRVPNFLLGFKDWHTMTPMAFYPQSWMQIPGTNSAIGNRLGFMVQIMEDSPDCGVTVATVDADAVMALLDAIRDATEKRREE